MVKSVCVLGDAFFDIIVPVNNLSIGGANKRKIVVTPGGTANVSVWLSHLGINSKFFGCIGEDVFGVAYQQNLKKENVVDLTFKQPDYSTGVLCCLLTKNGERTFITSRGANDYWKEFRDMNCVDEIVKSDIIYLTGYSLISKNNFKTLSNFFEAYDLKGKTWFNPGSYNIINKKLINFAQKNVDTIILNDREALRFANNDDLKTCLKKIGNNYSSVICTMGKEGAYTYYGGELYYKKSVFIKDVVDTTGAGDSFAAGYLSKVLQNSSISDALSCGHTVAASEIRSRIHRTKYLFNTKF